MATRTPTLSAPGFDPSNSRVVPIVDVTLRVVTPMIGGGVESGKVDPDFPVNGKSIRGHLRFWWRACHAHLHGDSESLFKAEAEIWGQAAIGKKGAKDASAVLVEVEKLKPGSNESVATATGIRAGYPPHALFPFTMPPHDIAARQNEFARLDTLFRLQLFEAPFAKAPHDQVQLAVSAWIAFGGVGMRTRRGCGALRLVSSGTESELDPFDHTSLAPGIPSVVANPYTPMLKGGRLLVRNTSQLHIQAWSAAIERLRVARNPGGDEHNPTYDVRLRGDLGLPIKSHGHDITGDNGVMRLASPIIVKPLPVSDTQSRPLVICLNAPHIYANHVRYSVAPVGAGPPAPIRTLFMNTIWQNWRTNCTEKWL